MAKYSDLDRVMKEARRNEANWSEDFRRVFNSIQSKCAVSTRLEWSR